MKKLQANNDKNAYALVDDDVYETIQQMGLKFSIMSKGYFQSTSHMIKLPGMTEKKRLQLHVFVWILKTGEEPTLSIDHKDIDKSNNRFSNLRLATQQEQNQNQSKMKNNTSGYIGVSHCHQFDNRRKKNNVYDYWRAYISKPDGHRESEFFDYDDKGLLEAVRWRDQKVREYYKEFAVPNLTDETP